MASCALCLLGAGWCGLVVLEATAISPEGRISWGDAGLWNDEQAAALMPIVESIKKWGACPRNSTCSRRA